jgi:hypothetical protein
MISILKITALWICLGQFLARLVLVSRALLLQCLVTATLVHV